MTQPARQPPRYRTFGGFRLRTCVHRPASIVPSSCVYLSASRSDPLSLRSLIFDPAPVSARHCHPAPVHKPGPVLIRILLFEGEFSHHLQNTGIVPGSAFCIPHPAPRISAFLSETYSDSFIFLTTLRSPLNRGLLFFSLRVFLCAFPQADRSSAYQRYCAHGSHSYG